MTIQKGGLAIWSNHKQKFVTRHYRNLSGYADSNLLNELGFICNDINNTCNIDDPNLRFNLIEFYNPRLAGKEERVYSQIISNGVIHTFYSIYEYIWFYRKVPNKLHTIKRYLELCIHARILGSVNFIPNVNDNHTIIGSFTLYLYYKVVMLLEMIHNIKYPLRFSQIASYNIKVAYFNIDNKILEDLLIVYVDLIDCYKIYGTSYNSLPERCYEYLNKKINFYLNLEFKFYSGPNMNINNHNRNHVHGGKGKSRKKNSKHKMKKTKKSKRKSKSRSKRKKKRTNLL